MHFIIGLADARFDGTRDDVEMWQVVHQCFGMQQPGKLRSGVCRFEQPLRDVVISWNADMHNGTGLALDGRVATRGERRAWVRMAVWGDVPESDEPAPSAAEAGGSMDVDTFNATEAVDEFEWAIKLHGLPDQQVELHRVDVVARLEGPALPLEQVDWSGDHDVPFVSQRACPEPLGSRICSPTSVAMLAMHCTGEAVDVRELAERMYDVRHGVYGNWAFAVAALGQCIGPAGYASRFARMTSHDQLIRTLRDHGPFAASMAYAQGDLPHAPQPQTAGHLVVVRGVTDTGDVICNDPAAHQAQQGEAIVYAKDAFCKAWLGHGGAAYVVERIT